MPGYEAPVNLAYSRRNRSAAVRIPMYSASPKAKRVEFRPPDPSCNPYLAFAAMMMAGSGWRPEQDRSGRAAGQGHLRPLAGRAEEGAFDARRRSRKRLTALEDDHGFLLKGDVFSEELIETFISYKRRNEAEAIRLRPHPYEFALYYDI